MTSFLLRNIAFISFYTNFSFFIVLFSSSISLLSLLSFQISSIPPFLIYFGLSSSFSWAKQTLWFLILSLIVFLSNFYSILFWDPLYFINCYIFSFDFLVSMFSVFCLLCLFSKIYSLFFDSSFIFFIFSTTPNLFKLFFVICWADLSFSISN